MRNGHGRRRCRLAVRWMAGVLVLSQLLLSLIVDQFAVGIRDPEYARLELLLRQRRAASLQQPTAVFIGSSRVAHGLDAARATGEHPVTLFNFGVSGAGPFFEGVLLDRLLAAELTPDVLFLELHHPFVNAAGPYSLDHGLLDGARLSVRETHALAGYGDRSRTGPVRRWSVARLLPAYRHSAEVSAALGVSVYANAGGEGRDTDPVGFRPVSPARSRRDTLAAKAHEMYDPFYGDFETDDAAWQQFRSAIARAQACGIRVAIVLMPEGTTFRVQYRPQAEDRRQELLRQLRDEMGVKVVDARAWLDDAAFYDGHHLHRDGAAEFATRFRTDVLEPWLMRPR